MNLLQAIILGIIQGLTEFIPVSSSGHLIVAEKLMGLDATMSPQQITAFVAVMQLGTLAAVILYFISDILSITLGWIQGNMMWLQGQRGYTARKASRLGWTIIIGTLPIATIGLLAKKVIEGNLTKSLWVIGTSMVVWALILWLAEQVGNKRREMEHAGMREALVVGFAQIFALIPGSSRSGTTIAGALFAGMTRESAARFSFLLSIPAVAASGILEMREVIHQHLLSDTNIISLIVATVVSAVVGYGSIAFLINYLRRNSTYAFIAYRLVIGAVILLMAFKGR